MVIDQLDHYITANLHFPAKLKCGAQHSRRYHRRKRRTRNQDTDYDHLVYGPVMMFRDTLGLPTGKHLITISQSNYKLQMKATPSLLLCDRQNAGFDSQCSPYFVFRSQVTPRHMDNTIDDPKCTCLIYSNRCPRLRGASSPIPMSGTSLRQ